MYLFSQTSVIKRLNEIDDLTPVPQRICRMLAGYYGGTPSYRSQKGNGHVARVSAPSFLHLEVTPVEPRLKELAYLID